MAKFCRTCVLQQTAELTPFVLTLIKQRHAFISEPTFCRLARTSTGAGHCTHTRTQTHKRDRPQWRSCLGRRCPHRPHIFIKPVLSSPIFQQPHPKKMIRTAPLRPSVRFLWKRSANGLKARTFISASWRKAEAPIPRAPIGNGVRAETPSPVLWRQKDKNATHQSGVSSEPLHKA